MNHEVDMLGSSGIMAGENAIKADGPNIIRLLEATEECGLQILWGAGIVTTARHA